MNKITKFFHELWNPHCTHCVNERSETRALELESQRCKSCEALERQIAVLIEQNNKLTEKIVNPNPQPIVTTNEVQPKPIHRGAIPFSVIRQQLEMESRARATALREAARPDSEPEIKLEEPKNSVKELEEAVGIRK